MLSRPCFFVLFLLAGVPSFPQSNQPAAMHSDHMEHHFDPKELAESFDDPGTRRMADAGSCDRRVESETWTNCG